MTCPARIQTRCGQTIQLAIMAALAAAPAAPVSADEKVDLRPAVKELEAWRDATYQKLRDAGKATQQNFETIDKEFIRRSRALEPMRTRALKDLAKKAGVAEIGQGPGGTAPEVGRGGAGDIDTKSFKGREFDRIAKTAQGNYHLKAQGDAFTIEELNVTVHREASPYRSATGSSAHEAELGRGFNKETAYGMSSNDPNIALHDNLKKAAHCLDTPPARLSNSDLQELGKMTGRNMQATGIIDSQLAAQSAKLKAGFSPEAAGIVRDNATPAERIQDIADYQARAARANKDAAVLTAKHAAATERVLTKRVATAEKWYECQLEIGTDPNGIKQAQQKLQVAREELLFYEGRQAAAKEGAARASKAAARISAEASGTKLPEGASPSQVREALVKANRAELVKASRPGKTPAAVEVAPLGEAPGAIEPLKPTASSRVLKGAGLLLMVYGMYQGFKEGSAQAKEESSEGKDGWATTLVKTGAYTLWHGLGISHAIRTGTEAGEASEAQFKKDLAEGRVASDSKLSRAWVPFRAVGWGVAKFTGLQDIKDAVVEGAGVIQDKWHAGTMANTAEATRTEAAAMKERLQTEKAEREAASDIAARLAAPGTSADCDAAHQQSLARIEARYEATISRATQSLDQARKRSSLGDPVAMDQTQHLRQVQESLLSEKKSQQTEAESARRSCIAAVEAELQKAATRFDGSYEGTFSGGSKGSIRLVVRGKAVSGSLSGVYRDGQFLGTFSGAVDMEGLMSTSLRGTINTVDNEYTFAFSGKIAGKLTQSGGAGTWSAQNQYGSPTGTWRVHRNLP